MYKGVVWLGIPPTTNWQISQTILYYAKCQPSKCNEDFGPGSEKLPESLCHLQTNLPATA